MDKLKTTLGTARMFLIGCVFFVLVYASLLVFLAHADTKVKVKSTKIGPKTKIVDIVAITQNNDGTSTLVLEACGTQVEFTANLDKVSDDELKKVVMENIDKACGN